VCVASCLVVCIFFKTLCLLYTSSDKRLQPLGNWVKNYCSNAEDKKLKKSCSNLELVPRNLSICQFKPDHSAKNSHCLASHASGYDCIYSIDSHDTQLWTAMFTLPCIIPVLFLLLVAFLYSRLAHFSLDQCWWHWAVKQRNMIRNNSLIRSQSNSLHLLFITNLL